MGVSSTTVALADARALLGAGRLDDALALLRRTLQAHPGDAQAHAMLGQLLAHRLEHDQALFHLERAAAAMPADGPTILAYGRALLMAGKAARAADVLGELRAKHPRHEGVLVAWGDAMSRLGRSAEALESLDAAAAGAAAPGPAMLGVHASLLLACGHADKALDVLRRLNQAAPGRHDVLNLLCSAMNYVPSVDRDEILRAHRDYAKSLHAVLPVPMLPPREPPAALPGRPLRVGLVSQDLGGHSVSSFVEPLLDHLDRARVTVVCYATATNEDATTRRLRPKADLWRHAAALDHVALPRQVKADQIDILIDLGGHTAGHRLPLFHVQPAPVQATYLGYPNTTGLPAIHYRLVDAHTDPDGAQAWAVETLVRLDTCFLCYHAPDDAPDPGPPPAGERGPVTFGSFNALQKINEPLLASWGRVLAAVPGARLVLKNRDLASEPARASLRRRWAALGLPEAALELRPPSDAAADHLAEYRRIDVALDTFPYHGTTTTCEALAMGVPVVTRAGDRHASRVGVSLLHAVGLPELVARDDDHLVEIAAGLARDRARLAALRRDLPQRLRASPLCDGPTFARRFADALDAMWLGTIARR